jgi:hypothetical protein
VTSSLAVAVEPCAKKPFWSPGAAKRSLSTLRKRTRKTEWDDAQVYQCNYCGRFHLGHDWGQCDGR